jgi:sporulation protein YlmC with PRC-barrel domain
MRPFAFRVAAVLFCAFAPQAVTAQPATAQLIGAQLVTPNGVPVGTVTDLLCEAAQDHIADLVVSRGDRAVAVPWTALTQGTALSTVVAVAPISLARDVSVADALDSDPMLLDVVHGLVGRPLVASDGTPVGHVAGLMLDGNSGTVDSLRIKPAIAGQPAKVLPWSAVADFFVGHAIILSLMPQQVAALPAMAARAAAF